MRVISLGWGVQSFTLAAMAALGDIPPVDYAIHSDTGWERELTYKFAAQWSDWLESRGVNVVTLSPVPRSRWMVEDNNVVQIPAYAKTEHGAGQLMRQCTSNWKIEPIKRFVRAKLKEQNKKPTSGAVEMLLGISTDEFVRAKQSRVKYITHSFPLLDLGMGRNDCINYLQSHNLPVPPKSSCTFCPYHSLATWQKMKRAGGADWEQVIEIDERLRDKRPDQKTYLLRDCIPVSQLPIPEDYGYSQSSFLDEDDVTCDSGYCFM